MHIYMQYCIVHCKDLYTYTLNIQYIYLNYMNCTVCVTFFNSMA